MLGDEALAQVFGDGPPLLIVSGRGGLCEQMGELGLAQTAHDVQDALLSGVPPDGHVLKVLSKVCQGVLATEESREGARGVDRGPGGSLATPQVGREAVGATAGLVLLESGRAGERDKAKGAVSPWVRSKIGSLGLHVREQRSPKTGGLKKGMDGLRSGTGERDPVAGTRSTGAVGVAGVTAGRG